MSNSGWTDQKVVENISKWNTAAARKNKTMQIAAMSVELEGFMLNAFRRKGIDTEWSFSYVGLKDKQYDSNKGPKAMQQENKFARWTEGWGPEREGHCCLWEGGWVHQCWVPHWNYKHGKQSLTVLQISKEASSQPGILKEWRSNVRPK